MMNKKLLNAAIAAVMAAGLHGTALAAEGGLADVPKDHWSYSAIDMLVQDGIIEGNLDGTFEGGRTMSRYEMASIVARAVENSKEADLKTRGLVEMIRAAEHVDFYATDENENIARQAASNLAWYTIPITMTQMYLMSSNGQRKHLSIIISRTGENRMLVDVANNLRERDGKILLITGEKDSSLARLADCVLLSGSAERVEVLGYRIWWVCAEYVVDMLMAAMIAQNGLKNICRRSKWLKENFVL